MDYAGALKADTRKDGVRDILHENEQSFSLFVNSNLGTAIYTLDPDGFVTSWNSDAELIKGYAREEILGRHFGVFLTPEDQGAGRPTQILMTVRSKGQFREEGWRVRKDGSRFWASVILEPLRDAGGQLVGFAKFTRDETRRRAAEEANDAHFKAWATGRTELESAHERLQLATDNGGIGIWDWDIQHDVMLWDDWMYRLYGTTRQAGGTGYELWQRHLHPDDQARARQAVADGVSGFKPYETEFRIVWDDGSIRHIRASGYVTRDAAHRPLRMIGCNQDITPLILAETARAEQQMQAKRWLELAEGIARVGHWTVSVPDQEIFWSDEIYRMHGRDKTAYTPDIVSAINAYHPEDISMVEANLARAIAEKSGFEFHARLVRPDGEIRQILSRGIAQTDYSSKVTSIFGVFIDVTEQKELEKKLEAATLRVKEANDTLELMAHTDELTGLSNRREMKRTLDRELRRSMREGSPISLIMIDLDFFKRYNDCYGHLAGDECLRAVANAIKGALHRSTDLAARYGGEEIAVILPNTDFAGAGIVAQSIVEAVRALRIEHQESPETIVTVSCGLAVMESGSEACDETMLFERADRALYAAKKAGRNKIGYSSEL